MTQPTLESLTTELRELEAANEAATGWGAAVAARSERIKEIRRAIAMSEQGATARPWRVWDVMRSDVGCDEYPEPHVGDVRILGEDDVCIGVIFGGYAIMPQLDKNAALIVTAVNDRDALLAQVKELRQALLKIADDDYADADHKVRWPEPTMIWQSVARAALNSTGAA